MTRTIRIDDATYRHLRRIRTSGERSFRATARRMLTAGHPSEEVVGRIPRLQARPADQPEPWTGREALEVLAGTVVLLTLLAGIWLWGAIATAGAA